MFYRILLSTALVCLGIAIPAWSQGYSQNGYQGNYSAAPSSGGGIFKALRRLGGAMVNGAVATPNQPGLVEGIIAPMAQASGAPGAAEYINQSRINRGQQPLTNGYQPVGTYPSYNYLTPSYPQPIPYVSPSVPNFSGYDSNLSINQFAPNSISPYSNPYLGNKFATDGPALIDSQGNYHGKLNGNSFDPDSVSNPFGRYGNKFSPDSINNQFGAGNPYNVDSPYNKFGSGMKIVSP